jgi:predicted RNase H-like nuclease (RuvC/YqgF family)
MDQILNHIGTYIIIAGLIIAGGIALYGLWDKSARERRKEVDGNEDRLIDLLKQTVDQLETKVNKQTTDIENLTKKVSDLERENETLIKVLQGRDDDTKKFQQQAFEAMKISRETHDIVTTLAKNMEVTNNAITKLIDLIGKHVDVLDHTTRQ